MAIDHIVEYFEKEGRKFTSTKARDNELGPLQLLHRNWKTLPGAGWNMIALPFAAGEFNYRVLVNQYDEKLRFNLVDAGVPNRGISGETQTNQFVVTVDYLQQIKQISAADNPVSGQAGPPDLPIHHEPGLFLHMKNETTDGLNIARLATIPHGDSVLALGRSFPGPFPGAPRIDDISGLPIGVTPDVDTNPYLAPYKAFHDAPFKGVVTAPGFPGFDPVHPNRLLELHNSTVEIEQTTVLHFDTTLGADLGAFGVTEAASGIFNIPFVIKQANATQMTSTFWINELKGVTGEKRLQLQYSQTVMLDFFPRRDGEGLIKWPHVSIATLVPDIPANEVYESPIDWAEDELAGR
ncbi:MAG: heme-binding protein [Thalassobaculaceae bacterium]|nr:heme-binding protein [Thalassobaculaceae bacterium]